MRFYQIWEGDDRARAMRLLAPNEVAAARQYVRLFGPGGDGEQDGDVRDVFVIAADDEAGAPVCVRVTTVVLITYQAQIWRQMNNSGVDVMDGKK